MSDNKQEYLSVNLIHVGKVFHIGKEDVDLDDRLDARSRRVEHGTQVRETLFLPSVHTGRERYGVSFDVSVDQVS
jgi:hypothetical protein